MDRKSGIPAMHGARPWPAIIKDDELLMEK
jgi:hypothetical protein